jgi:hypothetical protein
MAPSLQQLENDPRFRKLPYGLQQQLRAQWANKYLTSDSRFQQLPDQLQQDFVEKLISAPPKFSDPNVQSFFNATEEYRAKTGKDYTTGMKLQDFATGIYNGFSLAKLASRLESVLLEKVFTNADPNLKASARLMWDREEQTKWRQYYRGQMGQDMQKINAMDMLSGVGGALGFAGEMMSMLAFGGTPAAGRGLAAPALKALEKKSADIALKFGSARIGNWVAKSALPNLVHSLTASSVFQMGMEGAKAALTESNGKPSFSKVASAAALGYGAGALGDLIFFAATAPLAAAAKGVGKVFTLKKASKFLKDMGLEQTEFKEVLKSYANGDHIDRNIIERVRKLAPESADQLLAYEAHFRTLRNFETIDPEDPALKKLDAFKAGWHAEVDPATGKWTINHLFDKNIVKEFNDGAALLKFLEEPASNWIQALTPDTQLGLNKAMTDHASKLKALESATAGAMSNSYYIRQKVRATLGADDPTLATIQANLLKPKGASRSLVDTDLVQAARLQLKRKGLPNWDTIKIGSGVTDPGGYDLFIKRPTTIPNAKAELDFVSEFIEKVDLYGTRHLASGRVTPTTAEATEARVAAGAVESPELPARAASRAPATKPEASVVDLNVPKTQTGEIHPLVKKLPAKYHQMISEIDVDETSGQMGGSKYYAYAKKGYYFPSSDSPHTATGRNWKELLEEIKDMRLELPTEGKWLNPSESVISDFLDGNLNEGQWIQVRKVARSTSREEFTSLMSKVGTGLSELDIDKLYLLSRIESPQPSMTKMVSELGQPGYPVARKVMDGYMELRRTMSDNSVTGTWNVFTNGDVPLPNEAVTKLARSTGKYTDAALAHIEDLVRKNPEKYVQYYNPSLALDPVLIDVKRVMKGGLSEYAELGRTESGRIPGQPKAGYKRAEVPSDVPDSRIKTGSYEQPGGESLFKAGPKAGREPIAGVTDRVEAPKPVEVVAKVKSPAEEFDNFVRENAKKAGRDFARAYYKLVGYTDSWANYAATKMNLKIEKGPKGNYALLEQGKPPQTFDSFEKLTRELLVRSNDFHAIHASLKEQGITLAARDLPDGSVMYVAKTAPGGPIGDKGRVLDVKVNVEAGVGRANVLAESKNLREVVDHELVDWQPKAGAFIGPEITYVSSDFGQIEYIQNVATGDYQTILRHMSSFKKAENPNRVFISQGKEGTITFSGPQYGYELSIPEVGFRMNFESRADALSWMKKGWSSYDVLDRMADMKGYRVEMGSGGWYVWNEKNHFFAKHLAQVRSIMEQAPLPEWAPELLGKAPASSIVRPKVEQGMFRPEVFEPFRGTKNNPLVHVNHRWRPLDAWLEASLANGMDAEGVAMFKALELGRRGAHSDQFRVNQMTSTIFKDPNSPKPKLVSEEARRRIFTYMDAYDVHKAEVIRQYKELGKPLQDWEIKIADTNAEWLDSFFEKFGISREMKVRNYISHIRNMSKDEIQKLFRGTSSEIMHRLGAPRQIAEFFKNARSDDIMVLAKDMDAYSVTMKYTAIGHRALWMGESVGKIKAWSEAIGKDPNATPVQKAAAWRMGAYVDDVMGIHTAGEEQIRQMFTQMGLNMGIKNVDVMKNLYSTLYSASYLVNMGWRPWSAVRNLFQIWTTLAPRFGNAATARAFEYVVAHADEVTEYLKTKGHLLEELPVIGTEMIGNETTMAKLLHKGLGAFKNAEDVARGTAWATAKVQWDDATKLFARAKELGNTFDRASAVFLDTSGVNLVKESTQREVMGFLRENKWNEAFDAYAGEVINETMFAYASGLGPSAYRGVVGRAFGTFGTYPAWYIENFKRGLKYGSFANRLGFVARFFGNGLSLFAGFTALGISAKDFLPWVPMQFSGGPYYKFANKLLAATGSDYAARQARGEMKRELPRLLLPVTQLRNLQDALTHLDAGNITEAVAAVMSVPVISQGDASK